MIAVLPHQPLQASPLAGVGLLALGVAVIGLFARRSVRRLRPMLALETRPIEEVEPGMVEIEGTVASAGETVTARGAAGTADAEPVVTEFRSSNTDVAGMNVSLPVPQRLAPDVLSETTAAPFYVEDDTGRVLVDPGYADLSLAADHHETQELAEYREEAGWLETGDTVYVVGEAIPAAEYADRARPRSPVLRSIRELVSGAPQTADGHLEGEDLVITRTGSTDTFLISDAPEWRSWLRQGLMAAFWTVSGLAAIAGGVYLLVAGL